MICHICKQNTLYYENDEYNKYHIKCDICDLDLVSEIDLILYNFRLEKAFNTGKREQLLGNKVNPYPIDQVLLRKRWEEGWELGEQELEREAFISSAKNIKEEANKLTRQNDELIKLNSDYKEWQQAVTRIVVELGEKNYKFGFSYRKRLKKIFNIMKKVNTEVLV